MKYFVTVADREIEVEVDGDRIAVDGRTYTAALSAVPGTPMRQLLLEGRPVLLAMTGRGRGQWTLTIRGEQWDVEALDERTRHIRSLAGSGPDRHAGGVLHAPMPGLVVRVPVTVGQAVAAGASLVVLEAMKMENELRATSAGTVRAILVEPGQAVEKGQILVELE